MLTSLGRSLKLAFIAVIAVAFAAFAVANRDTVVLHFTPLPYTASMPLFFLTILCFGLGVAVAWLIASFKIAHSKRLFREERKRAAALHNEIGALRAERQAQFPITSHQL